jgi:hypothetical protein
MHKCSTSSRFVHGCSSPSWPHAVLDDRTTPTSSIYPNLSLTVSNESVRKLVMTTIGRCKCSDMKLCCLLRRKTEPSVSPPPAIMRPPSPLATTVNEIRRLSGSGRESLMSIEQDRRALIDATQRLIHLVQTPSEAVRNNAFSVCIRQTTCDATDSHDQQPTYNACVRIAIDLDLFRIIAASRKSTAANLALTTRTELEFMSEYCNTFPVLRTESQLVRLMRVLCGIGFVLEVGMLCYAPNSVTQHMTIPATAASIIHL